MTLFFLTAALAAAPARGGINSTSTMKDVTAAATPGTLLVFDLDDTLMEPTQDLGSDHWYYYLVKRLEEKEHLKEDAAYDKADEIWGKVQELIEMRTVEPETAGWIRERQLAGVMTMALTARTTDLAAVTEKQLASVGISFAEKPVFAKDLALGPDEPSAYARGALYVGGSDKGKSLYRFLKKTGLKPKKVVYVDDKMRLVESVSRAMTSLGMAFEGFRYGGMDRQAARFSRDMKDADLYCDGKLPGAAKK